MNTDQAISVEQAGNPPTPALTGGRGESATAPISLSLYSIERELTELLYARDQAQEEGAPPAELEAIDKTIAEYFAREVKKVDGICHALHAFESAADAADAEAVRVAQRAKSLRAQHDRIKAATLRAMQDHGVRVLETPTNKLRVQANGGKEPLEVEDALAVPDAYRTFTLSLGLSTKENLMKILEQCVRSGVWPLEARALLQMLRVMKWNLESEVIRAALKQQVKCSQCGGLGTQCPAGPSDALLNTCPRCEGRGTIPNTVPGAKLLQRGFHLRVE